MKFNIGGLAKRKFHKAKCPQKFKMKILIILLFLILISPVFAFQKPVGYVNDFANIISPLEEAKLNEIILDLEKNTTAEIAVVTVQTSEDLTPKEYATEIFNEWGIGKENDNGLLILLSLQERRIEVETGYGLEGILNDAKAGRVLDSYAMDDIRAGNYYQGLYNAVLQYSNIIRENKEEVLTGSQISTSDILFNLLFIIMVFGFPIWFFILIRYFSRPKCDACKIRMKLISRQRELTKGIINLGHEYYIVTYQCPKCRKTIAKKESISRHGYFAAGGRRSSRGFGGFGSGRSGGGGAGRSF